MSDASSLIAGTDINGALLAAVGMLEKAEGLLERTISMIILLTDGQPTSGESILCSVLPPLSFFTFYTCIPILIELACVLEELWNRQAELLLDLGRGIMAGLW